MVFCVMVRIKNPFLTGIVIGEVLPCFMNDFNMVQKVIEINVLLQRKSLKLI